MSRAESRRRSRGAAGALRWLARAAAWAMAAAALAGLGAGALADYGDRFDFFAHFRGHFALLALAAAVLSAFSGGRRLAFGAAALGALALAALWPVWRAQAAAEAECGVEPLTIATANLYLDNRSPAAAVAALLALDADILATQETGDRFWDAADGLRARYPYRVARRQPWTRTYASVLWSKRPILQGAAYYGDTLTPTRAEGVILVGGREIGVAGLHAAWPVLGPQWRQAAEMGRTLGWMPPDRIVMGDFNAAPWSAVMARIEDGVGARMAPGLRLTWKGGYPNPLRNHYELPWRIRRSIPAPLGHQIDHILLSPGIVAEQVDTVEIPGSDHRAVAARITAPRACGA